MEIVDARKLRTVDQMGPLSRALLAIVAFPLSLLYGAIMGIWRRTPRKVFDPGRPVISVGSVFVGGSGKTPLCVYLAGTLSERGQRVCIISRGYRRKGQRSPLVVSDGSRLLAPVEEAGDEPFLMASRLPGVRVVVGKDRAQAAEAALSALDPDVFILDDGFQTRSLAKTLEIVCLDAESLRSPGGFLPWGRLRESLKAIASNHVVVVLEDEGARSGVTKKPALAADRVFRALRRSPAFVDHQGQAVGIEDLRGGPVLLLSGIARPAGFEAACAAAGLEAPVSLRMDDHHWYNQRDAALIAALMRRYRCTRMVTTEKDLVRLPEGLRAQAVALRADVRVEDSEAFWGIVERGLRRA